MRLYRIEDRNQAPFIAAYRSGDDTVSHLYDWNHADIGKYKRRLQSIKDMESPGQIADRKSIAEVLENYHRQLAVINGQSAMAPAVFDNISRYASGAATVVTGQQAGICTGPLYTINKIISLLKSVEELQTELQEPLVPIFWIAGEDHDIDEIDHVYFNTRERLQKVAVDWDGHKPRKSVSAVSLTHGEVDSLIGQLKTGLRDSQYKQSVINTLEDAYREHSLSTAFAVLLYKMFSPFGLVMFDAHDMSVREREKPMFMNMVELADSMQYAYRNGFQTFTDTGYVPLIAVDGQKTGMYIDLYEKRYPILFSDGEFYIEGITERFSRESLLAKIADEPHRFSTNVFLRTVMQEFLFQPLLYIGGAAEVQYWGQMKPLFHLFGYQMPIVALRNSYTYITSALQAKLEKYDIDYLDVLTWKNYDYQQIIGRLIREQYDLASHFDSLQEEWRVMYEERLRTIPEAYVNSKVVGEAGENAWKKISLQLFKMRQLLDKTHNERYKELKADIRWIGNELLPNDMLQERVLNLYQFVNATGTDFLTQILYNRDNRMNGEHYIVHI